MIFFFFKKKKKKKERPVVWGGEEGEWDEFVDDWGELGEEEETRPVTEHQASACCYLRRIGA